MLTNVMEHEFCTTMSMITDKFIYVQTLFGSMNLLLYFNFRSSLIAIDFIQNWTVICMVFCTHIFSLMLKIRSQEEKHVELLKAGKQAKHRLEELAPEIRLKGKGKCWHISLSPSLALLFSFVWIRHS